MFGKDVKRLGCSNTRQEFIARIYDGETISEACAYMKLNPAAVGIRMKDDQDFENDIRDAQAFRADVMADKLENINQYEDDPIMASVISKNIQFLVSKRLRRIYGDKLDVNHTHTVNIRDALQAARDRTMQDVTPNALEDKTSAADVITVAPDKIIDVEPEIDPLS